MITYKDMAFCARDCANRQCDRNKVNINKPKDLEWMPVDFAEFKECEEWEDINDKRRESERNHERNREQGTTCLQLRME